MNLLLKGARVIDPCQNLDGKFDVMVKDGRIAAIEKEIQSEREIIDISGMILTPGLVDIHSHFREPGFEYKEDIASGARAAAAGGYTAAACMANTNPPIDNSALVEFVISQGEKADAARVLPIGCVSKQMQGLEMAELGDMALAGAAAFSDDGRPVISGSLMKKAMLYAAMFDKVIVDHCEEPTLFEGGQINEGYTSTLLGLAGIPTASEEIMIARDIALAREYGTRIHIAHISTKGSVEIIRQAKAAGVKISCEVTPHHLTLTEEAVLGYNTMAKVNPPLRTAKDIEALIEGLNDGTIDAIATDHAPHHFDEKDVEFDQAAFGLVGLETSLGLILTHLVTPEKITLNRAIELLTIGPSKVFGLNMGTLATGAPADITIIDPNLEWEVDPTKFLSKSRNTPYTGRKLRGKAVMTIVQGRIVYSDESRGRA